MHGVSMFCLLVHYLAVYVAFCLLFNYKAIWKLCFICKAPPKNKSPVSDASDPLFVICSETMPSCSQTSWIDWNSASLCFKQLFHTGV